MDLYLSAVQNPNKHGQEVKYTERFGACTRKKQHGCYPQSNSLPGGSKQRVVFVVVAVLFGWEKYTQLYTGGGGWHSEAGPSLNIPSSGVLL